MKDPYLKETDRQLKVIDFFVKSMKSKALRCACMKKEIHWFKAVFSLKLSLTLIMEGITSAD